MDEEIVESRQLEEMTAEVAADPGCDAFAALAESLRRAGRSAEARRIAEAGLEVRPHYLKGRVALGLALMDLGEADAAREVLSAAVPAAVSPVVSAVRCEDEASSKLASADDLPPWHGSAPDLELAAEPGGRADPPFRAPDDLEINQAFDGAESDPSEMMDVNRVAERVLEQDSQDFALAEVTCHETFDEPRGVPLADAVFVENSPAREPIDDASRVRILVTLESWLQNIGRQVV